MKSNKSISFDEDLLYEIQHKCKENNQNFSELVNFLSSSKDKLALANFKSLSNLLSIILIEYELNRPKSG